MQLVLATENPHKAEEIQSILGETSNIDLLTLSDFPTLKLPPETGADYRENAVVKAQFVAKETGHWAMGDDTGLEVVALGGAPGLYSARYAGEGVTYADNRKKLLKELDKVPDTKRDARFVCTVAVADPEGSVEVVAGYCEGRITRSEVGHGGFGYDPIFLILACDKTFSELSPDKKNKISHRGQAVRAAIRSLLKRIEN
jgi:XTP/dITP diphosphohydrolase